MLQAKWYKKLSKNGFEDIEQLDGNLKKWSNKKASVIRDSQAEYYRLAQQYLHSNRFPSKLDKVVWEYHSMGLSIVKISKQMDKSRGSIEWHINKMRAIFKLRQEDTNDKE